MIFFCSLLKRNNFINLFFDFILFFSPKQVKELIYESLQAGKGNKKKKKHRKGNQKKKKERKKNKNKIMEEVESETKLFIKSR